METAEGAAAWPMGDQEWSGHIGMMQAKPRKTTGNQIRWNDTGKTTVLRISMSKV